MLLLLYRLQTFSVLSSGLLIFTPEKTQQGPHYSRHDPLREGKGHTKLFIMVTGTRIKCNQGHQRNMTATLHTQCLRRPSWELHMVFHHMAHPRSSAALQLTYNQQRKTWRNWAPTGTVYCKFITNIGNVQGMPQLQGKEDIYIQRKPRNCSDPQLPTFILCEHFTIHLKLMHNWGIRSI